MPRKRLLDALCSNLSVLTASIAAMLAGGCGDSQASRSSHIMAFAGTHQKMRKLGRSVAVPLQHPPLLPLFPSTHILMRRLQICVADSPCAGVAPAGAVPRGGPHNHTPQRSEGVCVLPLLGGPAV